jgi:glycosyltransferase involved in cell wall biosynthesis
MKVALIGGGVSRESGISQHTDRLVTGLADHHLVVLPYRSATTSGIAPIARSAGRPVVATRAGGLSEMVVDGVDGVLCDPGDPSALRSAVERAWDERHHLALGARVSPAPSWAGVARSLRSALNDIPLRGHEGDLARTPSSPPRGGM